MKKIITEEIARQMLHGGGHVDVVAGVEYYISDNDQYTIEGDFSYFLAVPLVEIEVKDEEEFENLSSYNLPSLSVEIAFPRREDADEEGEWDAQYDLDAPRLLYIGERLPRDLDENEG